MTTFYYAMICYASAVQAGVVAVIMCLFADMIKHVFLIFMS